MAGWGEVRGWLLVAIALAIVATTGCAPTLRMAHVPAPESRGFVPTIASVSASTLARGRATGFWYHPDAIYAARLQAVKRAQRTIHFETYYMTPGRRADTFARALIERAKAGVKVKFLADTDGAKYLPTSYWKRLRAAGVEVRFYHPPELHRFWLYNTRTHRKLLVVDGREALLGGTGVSDEWDGPVAPWADVEVRLRGPVVTALEGVFAQHWMYVGGTADMRHLAANGPEGGGGWEGDGDPHVLVNASSPTDGDSPVRMLYQASIMAARERIWIASPYFLPSRGERQALLAARARGVDVRILSVGPRNDQALIYEAVREQACELVDGGVSVLEYQPAMMHAKAMLIDRDWVVTGSANFDPRSFYHNDELTIATQDAALAERMAAFFTEAFAKSRPLTSDELALRDGWCRAQAQLTLLFKWFL
jgi:cardiolipin synthase